MGELHFIDFGGNERLQNKEEIAKSLGCHTRTVERWSAMGMPFVPRGTRCMYKETACRNWLAQRDREGTASCQSAAVGSTG